MRLPSKVTSYKDSCLSLIPGILSELAQGDLSTLELFEALRGKDTDISDFVDALTCLYALRKIDVNNEGGELRFVGGDKL